MLLHVALSRSCPSLPLYLPQPHREAAYPLEPLLSTGTTVMGEPIRYPRQGKAHVTAAVIALATGGRTIMHSMGSR